MYTNNKSGSAFENTITVTPIKVEVNMSPAYPTPNSSGGSVAVAATTSARRNTSGQSVGGGGGGGGGGGTYTTVCTTSGNTGTMPKEKPSKAARIHAARKPPPTIDNFWPNILADVRSIQQVDAKHQALPLARIKKIMKLDENAKMIAAEAPLLFAKACEYFIQELTMRAWIHTEESKRRTLQRSDIAQAIANYDQFDFLIDIVPREDIKPQTGNHKKDSTSQSSTSGGNNGGGSGGMTNSLNVTNATTAVVNVGGVGVKMEQAELLNFGTLTQEPLTATTVTAQAQPAQAAPQTQHLQIIQQTTAQPQQLQYFITIPSQQTGQPQLLQQLQLPQTIPNGLTSQLTGLNLVAAPQQAQQLILTPAPTNTSAQQHQQQHHATLVQNLAAQQQHHQQQQQQIQLLQQVVTPSGEITNVPITINTNQLNLLRLQMQQPATHQPAQQQQVIIPTQCLTAQQLLQLTTGNTTTTTSAAGGITQQQLHQPQQQQHIVQHHHHHHQQQHHQQHNGNIFVNVSLPTQQQQAQQHQHQQTQSGQSGNSVITNERQLGNVYRSNC